MGTNKLFALYWGVCLFILPLYIRVGMMVPPRLTKDQLFGVLVGLSFVIFGFNPKKIEKKTILFCTFILSYAYIVLEEFGNAAGNNQFIMFSCGVLLFLQCKDKLQPKHFHIIFKSLAIAGAMQSILVLASYLNLDLYAGAVKLITGSKTYARSGNLPSNKVFEAAGSMLNRNDSGALMALSMGASFFYKPILLVLIIPGLIATKSVMPILSVIAASIFILSNRYLSKNLKKIAFLLASIGSVAVVNASLDSNSFFYNNKRFDQWANIPEFVARDKVKYKIANYGNKGRVYFPVIEGPNKTPLINKVTNTIFGRGLGYFYNHYSRFYPTSPKFRQAHNEYIEMFVSFGVFGSLLIISYILSFKGHIMAGNLAALYTFLIMALESFGHFVFHLSPLALIGIISMSMLFREKKPCLINGHKKQL